MLTQQRLKEVMHYDPSSGIFIRLKNGKNARTQKSTGCLNKTHGYLESGIDSKTYLLHRLAWLYMTGEEPTHTVGHRDHIRTNNSWGNLYDTTRQDSQKNLKMFKNNTSGVTGVSYRKKEKVWVATIRANGKHTYLTSGEDFETCVKARKAAEVEYGYSSTHGK